MASLDHMSSEVAVSVSGTSVTCLTALQCVSLFASETQVRLCTVVYSWHRVAVLSAGTVYNLKVVLLQLAINGALTNGLRRFC